MLSRKKFMRSWLIAVFLPQLEDGNFLCLKEWDSTLCQGICVW